MRDKKGVCFSCRPPVHQEEIVSRQVANAEDKALDLVKSINEALFVNKLINPGLTDDVPIITSPHVIVSSVK